MSGAYVILLCFKKTSTSPCAYGLKVLKHRDIYKGYESTLINFIIIHSW